MALDDQLNVLAPLKPGQVSEFAGYRSRDQLRQLRADGRELSPEQLDSIADSLHLIAQRARDLAQSARAARRQSAAAARS